MLFYDCVEPASPNVVSNFQFQDVKESTVDTEVQLPSDPQAADTENPFFDSLDAPIEVLVAASIPLPSMDDDDLSDSECQNSIQTTREESIATTISEYSDEDNSDENRDPNYKPTEAILVPKYIPQPNTVDKGNNAKHQGLPSSGSLVMV